LRRKELRRRGLPRFRKSLCHKGLRQFEKSFVFSTKGIDLGLPINYNVGNTKGNKMRKVKKVAGLWISTYYVAYHCRYVFYVHASRREFFNLADAEQECYNLSKLSHV